MIVRSRAPLRLGLAGGGTDLSPYCDTYGGQVLNVTIDMYAYCTLEPNESGRVEFIAVDRNERFESPSVSSLDVGTELMIHKGVYNRVLREFDIAKPLSLRMTTYSDAPAGSGLGSSSAMVVAILKAYAEWLNLPLGDYGLAHLAFEIERLDLQLSGGKQDQYAAAFGGFNFMEFFAENRVLVNPLRLKDWIRNELENSLIIYWMGTSRDSSKIIDEQIRGTVAGEPDNLEALHAIRQQALQMKGAILKGDFAAFAQCLNRAWEAKKRTSSAISNPEIDAMHEFAMSHGARAAKVSGAGGGGFMMVVCDPKDRHRLMSELKQSGGLATGANFTEKGAQAWTLYE